MNHPMTGILRPADIWELERWDRMPLYRTSERPLEVFGSDQVSVPIFAPERVSRLQAENQRQDLD